MTDSVRPKWLPGLTDRSFRAAPETTPVPYNKIHVCYQRARSSISVLHPSTSMEVPLFCVRVTPPSFKKRTWVKFLRRKRVQEVPETFVVSPFPPPPHQRSSKDILSKEEMKQKVQAEGTAEGRQSQLSPRHVYLKTSTRLQELQLLRNSQKGLKKQTKQKRLGEAKIFVGAEWPRRYLML